MVGYIVGVVLGVIIFLLQNFKPTSVGFRIMYLLTTIAFLFGFWFLKLGGWNILVLPVGEMFLAFISAAFFPYSLYSATSEYQFTSSHDYYKELELNDKIGRIKPDGFKQTYDRILDGIITSVVNSKSDFLKFKGELYSNNFYPISEHTKDEIMQHIRKAITNTGWESKDNKFIEKATRQTSNLFNAFVSLMAIHEEATREIERLKKLRDSI